MQKIVIVFWVMYRFYNIKYSHSYPHKKHNFLFTLLISIILKLSQHIIMINHV